MKTWSRIGGLRRSIPSFPITIGKTWKVWWMPHVQCQIYEISKSSFLARKKVIKIFFKAFYTVHPSLWTRVTTWWFSTFLAPAIKHKIHNIHEVRSDIWDICWEEKKVDCFPGERAWLSHQLNGVWHSYVHTGANTNFPEMNRMNE